MQFSRLKRFAFTMVAVAGSFTLLLVALIGADFCAHHRVERSAGLNRHGYRGPVVGRKQPGDIRVVMLGGRTIGRISGLICYRKARSQTWKDGFRFIEGLKGQG